MSESREPNTAPEGPKRSNVLLLDGGGVRGLSSLLILQALMKQINSNLRQLDASYGELHPHHVFQLVAGTSTGGLIALMFGKIGLTVDECIRKYEELSEAIFGKKHWRGSLSWGLASPRYSGASLENCVQNLLRERGLNEGLPMEDNGDKIASAVVCREHSSSSRYSKLIRKAVPICSLPCNLQLNCKVCEAARATSAAPTYFSAMKIDNRLFIDGGLEHNNPSFAIYYHYTSGERKRSTRRTWSTAPDFSPHPPCDYSCVRYVNIGTGVSSDELIPGKLDWLADFVPGTIRQAVFWNKILRDIAVNSQKTVDVMETFAYLKPEVFKYERLDADHGVSNIRLDRYDALEVIRKKTNLYLADQRTKDHIEEIGTAIANEYHDFRSSHPPNEQPQYPIIGQSHLEEVPISILESSSVSTAQSKHDSDHSRNGAPVVNMKSDKPASNGTALVAGCLA